MRFASGRQVPAGARRARRARGSIHPRPVWAGLAAGLGLLAAASAWAADTRGWLGIYHEAISAPAGLRVTAVWPDSPAEQGGLEVGDAIIGLDHRPFDCPAESVRAVFTRRLTSLQVGDQLRLSVQRDGIRRELTRNGRPLPIEEERDFWRKSSLVVDSLRAGDELVARAGVHQAALELTITMGPRPEAGWPPARTDAEIDPAERYRASAFAPLLWAGVDSLDWREPTDDLLERLARCHQTADPHRLDCMMFAHRQPLRLESLAADLTARFAAAAGADDVLLEAGRVLRPGGPVTAAIATGSEPEGLEPLLAQITAVLEEATAHQRRAFAAWTEEDRAFVEAHRFDLSDAFAADIYIHFDEDRNRFSRNRRLIALAERVDDAELLAAARSLARLADPDWARKAGAIVRAACADTLTREVLLDRMTPYGRILIGGTGRHWYRDTDAAFILDLGGDDFYTGNNGGSAGWAVPLAVCLDLAGDDAYESTTASCQGTGCLGVGALLDLEGDDRYIGLQWAQGTGYFGVGWVQDLAGDDIYRGRTFCQGVGLFGVGFLLDQAGNDRYEGDAKVQGVGLAHGLGAHLDRGGDDHYYAKGLYPTNYGDAGIFDAWAQGCGIGFRTVASGGLGLLIDGGGADEMEAGNFSQGGGYYYGFGLLCAGGLEDDRYLGSRYNQGFSAHQAVGVFLEDGGNDFYTTRQAVAQGLAWDECVTLFVDRSGDDWYQGGGGFSQGASAHNSFCFFVDGAGKDRYEYAPGQARAGGNDYHGGTSLSFFLDEGGDADTYDAESSGNDARRAQPEHGLFLDLPSSAESALRAGVWEGLRTIE